MTHDLVSLNDQDFPAYPPRSKLFNLEPFGQDSASRESFRHYVNRLATAHRLTLHNLLLHLLPPAKIRILGARKHLYPNVLNNELYLADLFEKATHRSNLHLLSLQRLRGSIANLSADKRVRKWCSLCLKEQSVPYECLLWTVSLVDACARHRGLLSRSCPSCGRHQPPLQNHDRKFVCVCGVPLDEAFAPEASPWQIHLANQASLLIAARDRSLRPNSSPIHVFESLIQKSSFLNQTEACRFLGLPDSFPCTLRTSTRRLSFQNICLFSYCFSVPAPDLLWEAPSAWRIRLRPPPAEAARTTRLVVGPAERSKLEQTLFDQTQKGVSLRRAAKEIGRSPAALKRHFSRTCENLVRNASSRRRVESMWKRLCLERQITQFLKTHSARNGKPSFARFKRQSRPPLNTTVAGKVYRNLYRAVARVL